MTIMISPWDSFVIAWNFCYQQRIKQCICSAKVHIKYAQLWRTQPNQTKPKIQAHRLFCPLYLFPLKLLNMDANEMKAKKIQSLN